MIVLLLVIHIMVAISLVGVILLQKSEGGALGMGGGGMSGFMTGRSTANLLTRTTAILAAAFMATSALLVVHAQSSGVRRVSIIDRAPTAGRPRRAAGANRSGEPRPSRKPPTPSPPLAH